MAAKNSLKIYLQDGYYHLYNRGVAKNDIFLGPQDYSVFLSYLKEYLSPPIPPTPEELKLMEYTYFRKNYHESINLLAFCLMPNHFHLLVKQNEARAIESFMRSLLIRYSTYFNRHYQRVGHVFQDVYKGVLVNQEGYFLWLSRYIHRNPLELLKNGERLSEYEYSSYPVYLGMRENEWVNSQEILGSIKDYKSFVEGPASLEPEDISAYTLES